jgi:hypothetical protein
VQDHRRIRADVDEFGQVLLGQFHIDNALGVVAKDTKKVVYVQVDRRGLDALVTEGINNDPARVDCLFDGPV